MPLPEAGMMAGEFSCLLSIVHGYTLRLAMTCSIEAVVVMT
jgi:hypothetical protein